MSGIITALWTLGGLEWRSDEWAGGGEGAARDTYIRAARCVRGASSRYASGNGLVSATLCRAITSS